KIREDIAKETARDWKGLRVTVKISLKNCQAKFIIVPSATTLVIKSQKERERDKEKTKIIKHTRNILVDDVIEIVKVMKHRSMEKPLVGNVKEILGTCVSERHTIDGKDTKNLQSDIDEGETEILED
ncbi:hypothetical protein KI387_021149, partial [Taxus chinensis]